MSLFRHLINTSYNMILGFLVLSGLWFGYYVFNLLVIWAEYGVTYVYFTPLICLLFGKLLRKIGRTL
jgi:hypothetical protein